MEKTLTCTVCPIGCRICVTLDGKRVVSVKGNTCERGKIYAENECINPKRCVTSTVICEDGSLLSVKTDCAIPKDKIFECMKLINSVTARLPIKVGDVIIEDVFGSNIIATKNILK